MSADEQQIAVQVGHHLGRYVLRGDSPWGSVRGEVVEPTPVEGAQIVTDDGRVIGHLHVSLGRPMSVRPTQPGVTTAAVPELTSDQIETAKARLKICTDPPCDAYRGATLEISGRPIYRVQCADCGCGGLSLVRGRCPRRLWREEVNQ